MNISLSTRKGIFFIRENDRNPRYLSISCKKKKKPYVFAKNICTKMTCGTHRSYVAPLVRVCFEISTGAHTGGGGLRGKFSDKYQGLSEKVVVFSLRVCAFSSLVFILNSALCCCCCCCSCSWWWCCIYKYLHFRKYTRFCPTGAQIPDVLVISSCESI